MIKISPPVLLVTLCLVGRSPDLEAKDWPQWRGPDRNGISTETGLLKSWPAGGPKRLWVYEQAGRGYAGSAVAEGKVLTMGTEVREGADREVVLVISSETGKKLWSAPIDEVFENDWGDGPRGTPTVDQGRVYALGGQGTLVCLEFSSGRELWRVSLTRDLGGKVPQWGYAESPLVDGDRVICTPGGGQGALAALDKNTGRVLWRSKDFTEGAHYSSPVLLVHGGVRQYVQRTEKFVVGVAAGDGSLVWKGDFPGRVAVIPTPVVRDGYVYLTAGYSAGSKLIRLDGSNQPSTAYMNRVMKNHHGGVILLGDHIYGHSDAVGWVCQDFVSGEELSVTEALGKGAVSYADGRFYCLEEDTGTVALFEASPRGWVEHGRFTLQPQSAMRKRQGKIWTHPVIANGRLYLRDQEYIYCFAVGQ